MNKLIIHEQPSPVGGALLLGAFADRRLDLHHLARIKNGYPLEAAGAGDLPARRTTRWSSAFG
jgi:hypothetical protein